MEQIHYWIHESTGLTVNAQYKLLTSLVVLGGIWVIRKLILAYVAKRQEDLVSQYNWRKTTSYITYVAIVLLIATVWIEDGSSFATFLGLFSAGLAIALKDPVMNMAGWFFIIWRKPFKVGDRIEIKGVHGGDVIDIRLFQFTIIEIGNWVGSDQSTGRIIHIPNLIVFSQPLANYSKGFDYIWNEISVTITFESNWQKAKLLLSNLLEQKALPLSQNAGKEIRKAARQYLIFYKNLTPIVYTSIEKNGVKLTMRYLCPPRQRRGSEQELWEEILAIFSSQKDIDFAYPTTRFVRKANDGEIG